jgi:hypothetical protein
MVRPSPYRGVVTATEELTLIDDAIRDILAVGQSASVGGRSWSKADLSMLYQRQTELKRQVAREARGGGLRVSTVVPR